MTKKIVDDLFLMLFCEKNSDATKHLRLRGKELFQRFGLRLNQVEMPQLASFLSKYSAIVSVDLSYNNIGNEGIEILAKNFFENPNKLLHLNLLHCDIGPQGLRCLSKANHLDLKSLRLEGNKLGVDGAQFIGAILVRCQQLENLDIGETDQTNESIEAVLMVLEKSSIKCLNISRIIPRTYYSKYNTTELADDIGTLMKLNDSLEVLRIQKCEFDGHDIEVMVQGLKYHRNLIMLDLGANRVGDHGLTFIGAWLKTKPNLIGLRIPANNITTAGGQTLALCLPFSRIRYLDLQYNRIGSLGIRDILVALKKPILMRMLFIWGNGMSSTELETLDKLLKTQVLEQQNIDIKIYTVDGVKKAAYNPSNPFMHRAYSISDDPWPKELKIVRKNIYSSRSKPRALIDIDFIDRYPAGEEAKKGVADIENNMSKEVPFKDEYDDDSRRLFV